MKKLIAVLLLLIFSENSFAQNTEPSPPITKADYLKKSRSNRIGGFVLLGAGAITLISISGGNTDLSSLGILVALGGGAVIGSVPLFIAAGKNKRKYNNATASFMFEKTQSITQQSIHQSYIPAVGVMINF